MALQLNLTTSELGLALPECYARIVGANWNSMGTGNVSITVGWYANKAARDAGNQPYNVTQYDLAGFDFESASAIKALLYAYLKTLPEFAGATDV